MHVHSPIFHGQVKEKNLSNNLHSLGAKEDNEKYFFVFNKYQSVTNVSKCIFQGLFKNIVFRYVASVKKKLWAIINFKKTFF